jgi:hypothetical protein
MKIQYLDKLHLSKGNKERLNIINEIINEYLSDGYVMTLRQLYYQLVSRDVIPNQQKEYAKLSNLLKQGRMAGIVDWAAIEDRGRMPNLPYWVVDIPDALNDIHKQYRLNRMKDQLNYVEIWVEKDALSNVMKRITHKYHVNLMVNKGYSSTSAMHEAYQRFANGLRYKKGKGVLLYFGDHDPSGKDMVNDIENRLKEFGLKNFIVENPALNMDQIRLHNLPENPAKLSDPRAAEYIEKYGEHSWELDALPPPVLIDIVEKSLVKHISISKYHSMLKQEEIDKKRILEIKNDFDE